VEKVELKMLSFEVTNVVVDGPSTELLGLSDVEFVQVNGSWNVVVASEAEGAITTFGFENNALTGVLDTQSYSSTSGTRMISYLTIAEINGETMLLPATRYEDQTNLYSISGTGILGAGVNSNGIGQLTLNTAVTVGANTFVYSASNNGITAYSVDASLNFTQVDQELDTGATYLGDVSAFANATVAGIEYLFVASAYDAGVSSYVIDANGALSLADTVTPGEFSGFYLVQDLITLEVSGQDYLVMASAGTSSLTVYSVSANGALFETDFLIDSLDTRFEDASVLESFVYDGRSFVIAAGSDDGITILELTATGQLWEMASLADTYDTTLANVTGISAEVINGSVEILISSATDHGFTQITLNTSLMDSAITGSAGNDFIRGTSSSDLIYGLDGNDNLVGGSGADTLVDGAGIDYLTGEGGRDVFMFVEDGELDIICDFSVGDDQIDLSHFAGVFGLNDIEIRDWCNGVIIIVNEDAIIVQNQDSREYFAEDFGASDFLF
jgi:Ca2+-binding RTX toxin-like protein